MNTDNTEQLLKRMVSLMEKQQVPDDLWTKKHIASYLDLSPATVQQRIIKRDDFPRAVIIPSTEDGGTKRWKKEEVMRWATKRREVKT